jgi:cell wall-associated NlpC family hydrolase
MSVSSVTIASGASVDTATNEMIECSIDGLSIDNLTDVEATRMMGLSSSSKSNLKQKAASMWNYFACNSYPATLEIMGDPTIKVSSYIYVTVYTKYGYPHHTSGVYQITKANDNISGGTYITTLTLQKVGSSKARISSETDSEASSTSTDSSGNTGTLSSDETYSDKANKIIAATSTVPSAGSGYCAKWVSQVYEAAGLGYIGGNACDMYNNYCTSSDLSDLEPGMIVAVSTHSHSTSGQKYGHVGIYIGDGMVVSNIGTIKTQTLDSFISYYGDTVTVKWGWAK